MKRIGRVIRAERTISAVDHRSLPLFCMTVILPVLLTPFLFLYREKVTCLSLSIDGQALISGSADSTIRVWNTRSRQCMRVISQKGMLLEVPGSMNIPF